MKAFVTSIGESTTELCVWSLQRNGFDVHLIQGGGLLVDKLKTIYEHANDDFLRVDADVVVNKKLTPQMIKLAETEEKWWLQFQTFGWFKQDIIFGGAQFIKKEALPALRAQVDDFHRHDRPETMLSRIDKFHNPRRFDSVQEVIGIHGFAANDVDRIIRQKQKRNYFDTYDFELADKLEGLLR
jgi:hypothetical protein